MLEPNARTAPASRNFGTIEAYRGLAALAVFCVHGQAIVGESLVPRHGYLAVDLFFILSGIVMAHSYDRRFADGSLSSVGFMWLRVVRLLPVIVLATLFAAVVNAAILRINGPTPFHSLGEIALSTVLTVALIPQPWVDSHNYYPLNGPFWSLLFELAANLLFALSWRQFSGRRLFALIGFAGLALVVIGISSGDYPHGFYWSQAPLAAARTLYCFFVGVLIARSSHCDPVRSSVGMLVGIVAGAALFWGSIPGFDVAQDLVADLLFLPTIAWLAIRVEPGPLLERASRWLGEASYPVYAFHLPLILAVVGAAKLANVRWLFPSPISALVLLLLMVAGGVLLHRLIDEPTRRWLKRRFRGDNRVRGG